MDDAEESLEGWVPAPEEGVTLAQIVDAAFEYRGDVTVDRVDGSSLVGYLFNRHAAGATPFVQLIETATGDRVTVPYAEIANIRFTGRDTAAGASWEAWKRRRETQARASRARE